MRDGSVSTYSGIAGRVVCGSFSPTTALTTIVLGFTLGLEMTALSAMRLPTAALMVAWAILLLATARLALNAYHGDWRGSVLSVAGGPWKDVAAVACRFLALGLIWMAPLVVGTVVFGVSMAASAGAMNALNMNVPQPPVLLMAYAVSFFIAHPVMLIAAVSAPDFGSIFSRGHWSATFSGRWGDVFVLCALYAGGPIMLFLLLSPLVMGIAAGGVQAAIAVTTIIGGLVYGYWITVFAKLCGSFAAGSAEVEIEPIPLPGSGGPRVSSSGPVPQIAPHAAPPQAVPPGAPPMMTPPGAPGLPGPAIAAVPAAIPLSGSTPAPGLPPVPPAPSPTIPLSGAGTPPVPPEPSHGPPLLDAPARIAAAKQRSSDDMPGAIKDLETLRGAHAPNGQLLHTLCTFLQAAGEQERAITVAKECVRVCLNGGQTEIAAEAFRIALGQYAEIGLSQEEILTLAGAYKPMGDLRSAARVYALVIHADSTENRAIKGLLQVAEMMQRDSSELPAASKIYKFLLDHCSASPLAVYMQEGYDKVQRQISQPTA